MTVYDIISKMGLQPLPGEGGFFRETFRSPVKMDESCPSGIYTSQHCLSTCIYYLITPESFSAMHQLPGEEIWHFYLGSPAQQLQLLPDGTYRKITLGSNITEGEEPQVIVPAQAWQGTRLVEGGEFALFGTTMSPGFEFSDYIAGNKNELVNKYPNLTSEISTYFHV